MTLKPPDKMDFSKNKKKIKVFRKPKVLLKNQDLGRKPKE